jgi:hypothetical protein
MFTASRGLRSRSWRRLAFNEKIDGSPPAAERLLLAGIVADRRVAMLGKRLARKQDQLLGTAALGVDIDHQLQADPFQIVESPIRNLDRSCLGRRQHDARATQILACARLCVLLLWRQHTGWPPALRAADDS